MGETVEFVKNSTSAYVCPPAGKCSLRFPQHARSQWSAMAHQEVSFACVIPGEDEGVEWLFVPGNQFSKFWESKEVSSPFKSALENVSVPAC